MYPQSLPAFGQKKSENDLKLNVSFARRVDGIGHSRIGGKTPRKSKKPAATGHLGAVIPLATHTNLTTCAIRIAPITRQSPAIPEGRRTKINYMVSIPQDIEIVNENILYLVFSFSLQKTACSHLFIFRREKPRFMLCRSPAAGSAP